MYFRISQNAVYLISTQISIVAFLASADAPEIDTRCNWELPYAD
jgi:hypothetical protein